MVAAILVREASGGDGTRWVRGNFQDPPPPAEQVQPSSWITRAYLLSQFTVPRIPSCGRGTPGWPCPIHVCISLTFEVALGS